METRGKRAGRTIGGQSYERNERKQAADIRDLLGVWRFLIFAHFKDMNMTFTKCIVDLPSYEVIPKIDESCE
jgi:hypothetical protein